MKNSFPIQGLKTQEEVERSSKKSSKKEKGDGL